MQRLSQTARDMRDRHVQGTSSLTEKSIHCNAMYCYEANPSPGLGQYDDGPCEKNERESR